TAQRTVRIKIFRPQFLPRFLDHREIMMRIELTLAQPGEVFSATEHAGVAQPAEKLSHVDNCFLRTCRYGAGSHHRAGGLEREIGYGCEINIESHGPALGADEPPVF